LVTAVGGAGGQGRFGGAGGAVSGSTASASGYSAVAGIAQTGGAGGAGEYNGGAGASSSLTNAVSGATRGGYLDLFQTAIGGAGGSELGPNGAGGAGGYGTSSLTVNNTTAGSVYASVTGDGGAGGGVTPGGNNTIAGAGGAGSASVTLTGAHTAAAVATANGGAGLTVGTANATASATAGASQLATALASSDGSSGQAGASATTTGSGVVSSLTAHAQGAVAGSATTALSEANSASPLGFDTGGHNSYAFGTLAPGGSVVTSDLASHPNVAAALGGAGADVFAAGTLGDTGAAAGVTYNSSITYTLNTTGDLVLGLLDQQTLGSGFSSLALSVQVGGTTVVSQSFSSLAAAQGFFHNDALDLGAVASSTDLQVTVDLQLVASAAGSGFAGDFLLGTSGTSPPPGASAVHPAVVHMAQAISGFGDGDTGALSSLPLAGQDAPHTALFAAGGHRG
jgi:hypothetical protein